jgi:hypothetical protein
MIVCNVFRQDIAVMLLIILIIHANRPHVSAIYSHHHAETRTENENYNMHCAGPSGRAV